MSSQQKKRSASFVKMEERAVQQTRVKDLISKYNTKKTTAGPKLRRFGRRKARKTKRRGSLLLAVPTEATQADPDVGNSKSAKELEILRKLEQQQAEFQQMLDEQRAEKEALAAKLAQAEKHLDNVQTLSVSQAKEAEEERQRLEELMLQQREDHKNDLAAAAEEEKNIEQHYDKAVKVRRASAAVLGKALLDGAFAGAAIAAVPDGMEKSIVAAVEVDLPPPLPTRQKPLEPEFSDSSSSSSNSDLEDGSDNDPADYEANIEHIYSKHEDERTPIEKAALRSAMSAEAIPALVDLIPDFQSDPTGLFDFLNAPIPYEQGICQCELHRKGKCFYFYLSESEENDTKFLMFAQDRSGFGAVNLMISMVANGKRNDPSFLGKVRGNVLNTKYVIFDNGAHPKEHQRATNRCEKAFVNYTLYNDAPRKMTVVVPKIRDDESIPVFQQDMQNMDLLEAKYNNIDMADVDISETKQPRWDRKRDCFVLDFKKRATEASVKNFLLVTKDDPEHDSVLFGKRGKDEFNVDVQYPMSFFQAFTICLTAIYSKSSPSF